MSVAKGRPGVTAASSFYSAQSCSRRKAKGVLQHRRPNANAAASIFKPERLRTGILSGSIPKRRSTPANPGGQNGLAPPEFATHQAVARCAQSLKKHQQMNAGQLTSGHIQPSAHSRSARLRIAAPRSQTHSSNARGPLRLGTQNLRGLTLRQERLSGSRSGARLGGRAATGLGSPSGRFWGRRPRPQKKETFSAVHYGRRERIRKCAVTSGGTCSGTAP